MAGIERCASMASPLQTAPFTMTNRMISLHALLLALAACATASEEEVLVEDLEQAGSMPDYAGTSDVERLVRRYCPGVDYAAGVPTYRGLAGIYQRATLPAATGEPWRLVLATTQDDPDARGTFTGLEVAAGGQLVPYAGAFFAIPDNPAIGAALALDRDADGAVERVYFVLGLRRGVSGDVSRLCLAGTERPILMRRAWL